MWDDAWLGGNGSRKIITPARILADDATVDALIDGVNHRWRLDLISEIFFPIDLERITSVPISTVGSPDERAWVAAEDGVFRVKDMYALALGTLIESSSSNGSDPIWKKLWNLNVHPKAKNYLWRAAWDILPHGSNLRKKGIDHKGKCQRCGLSENNTHVLRDCSWSKQVWNRLVNVNDLPQHTTFREWLAAMMEQENHQAVELFCVCAWQIWRRETTFCLRKSMSLLICAIKGLLTYSRNTKKPLSLASIVVNFTEMPNGPLRTRVLLRSTLTQL